MTKPKTSLASILVGLDGSAHSEAATEWGIRLIQQSGGLMVGIGIVDEPGIREAVAVPLGAMHYKLRSDDVRYAEVRRQVEQFLDRFSHRCIEAGVSYKLLESFGSPEAEFYREAQRYDLIVMGRHTYYHTEAERHHDKTLRSLLQLTPRPVVAIPEKYEPRAPVVVAYDGSPPAARALYAFWASGVHADAPIYVASVFDDHAKAARCAGRAVEFLAFHQMQAEATPVVSDRPPAEPLLDKAEELGAGLIVMGAYGKRSLSDLWFGSVTRGILAKASTPLFLFH